MDKHPVFKEGPSVTTTDGALWAEMQACITFGIPPDEMFLKDRFMRMMIVGSNIANNAINSMRSYDKSHEAK